MPLSNFFQLFIWAVSQKMCDMHGYKMKKVMILGASQLQVPAILKVKELGYQIIAVDYDENAVGFPLADIKLLVSTIDQEEVYRQALKYKPDAIITSTSDAPVRTVAYVNEKLGNHQDMSYEDALCATNKEFMRKRLKKFNVPIPIFYIVNNYDQFKNAISNFLDFCVVKPADNAGSRGVQRLDVNDNSVNLEELYYDTKKYSKTGIVLVEEYMEGKEVSVEAITVNGKTDILAITDKMITPPPFFVEIGHSEQSQLPDNIKEKIRKITIDAIHAINIINGPSHSEIKITQQGPKIVEIAARLGGDFITSKLVPLSTGVDLVGNSVLLALREFKTLDLTRKCDYGSAIRFLFSSNGIIESIDIDKELNSLEGIEEIKIYKNAGDYVQGLESSNDRIGHVITKSDNTQHAIEIAEYAITKIQVNIKCDGC